MEIPINYFLFSLKSILRSHLNHSNRIINEQVMATLRKLVETGKPEQVVPVQVGQKLPEPKLYRYKFKLYRYKSLGNAQNVCFLTFFHTFDPQSLLHFKHTSKQFQIHLGISFLLNSSFNFIYFSKSPSWISSKTLLIWVITHTQTRHED